jgi:hypothetical protein
VRLKLPFSWALEWRFGVERGSEREIGLCEGKWLQNGTMNTAHDE